MVGSFSTAPDKAVNCNTIQKIPVIGPVFSSTLPQNTPNERLFMHVCVHRIPVSKAQPFHSTGARQDITMSASDMSLAERPKPGSEDCRLHSSVLIGAPAYNNECHSNSM